MAAWPLREAWPLGSLPHQPREPPHDSPVGPPSPPCTHPAQDAPGLRPLPGPHCPPCSGKGQEVPWPAQQPAPWRPASAQFRRLSVRSKAATEALATLQPGPGLSFVRLAKATRPHPRAGFPRPSREGTETPRNNSQTRPYSAPQGPRYLGERVPANKGGIPAVASPLHPRAGPLPPQELRGTTFVPTSPQKTQEGSAARYPMCSQALARALVEVRCLDRGLYFLKPVDESVLLHPGPLPPSRESPD